METRIIGSNIQEELGNLYTDQMVRILGEPTPVEFNTQAALFGYTSQTEGFRDRVYQPALDALTNRRYIDNRSKESLHQALAMRIWREMCLQYTDKNQPPEAVAVPSPETIEFFRRLYNFPRRKIDFMGPMGLAGVSDPHGMVITAEQTDDQIIFSITGYLKYRIKSKRNGPSSSVSLRGQKGEFEKQQACYKWALRNAELGYLIPISPNYRHLLDTMEISNSCLPIYREDLQDLTDQTYQNYRPSPDQPTIEEFFQQLGKTRSIFLQSVPT